MIIDFQKFIINFNYVSFIRLWDDGLRIFWNNQSSEIYPESKFDTSMVEGQLNYIVLKDKDYNILLQKIKEWVTVDLKILDK